MFSYEWVLKLNSRNTVSATAGAFHAVGKISGVRPSIIKVIAQHGGTNDQHPVGMVGVPGPAATR